MTSPAIAMYEEANKANKLLKEANELKAKEIIQIKETNRLLVCIATALEKANEPRDRPDGYY